MDHKCAIAYIASPQCIAVAAISCNVGGGDEMQRQRKGEQG